MRKRPCRAWGFPPTGVICIAGWTAVALFAGLMDLRSTAWGALVLAVVSVPAFLWLKRWRNL